MIVSMPNYNNEAFHKNGLSSKMIPSLMYNSHDSNQPSPTLEKMDMGICMEEEESMPVYSIRLDGGPQSWF